MRKFVCEDCGGKQFSTAALENQRHPGCIYCGSVKVHEEPMTKEDTAIKPKEDNGQMH